MASEEKELQVGDRLYGISRYGDKVTHLTTIVRVTKTQAITKSKDKFQRKYFSDGFIRPVGSIGFNSMTYYLETEELKNKFLREKGLNEIKRFDFDSLDKDEVFELVAFLRKFNQD